ncbi:MAG: NAD(P)H-quinone oxidoreductase subunit 4, partial [Pleurocapsa sp.]
MEDIQIPWLTATIVLPLIASMAIPVIPDKNGKTVRLYTLSVGLINLALIVYGFWSNYSLDNTELQLQETYSWIPQLGLNWSVGVDGLCMPLILLSGLVTTMAILASWKVDQKPKLYYFLILVLYSAQIGVFAAQDLLLFF